MLWKRWIAHACAACGLGWILFSQAPVWADAPAVTDFGGDAVAAASSQPDTNHYAVFLTLYQDGHQEWMVRPISDDAIVSFRASHSSWELNHPLMWFLNMPVYVKEIQSEAMAESV